VTSPSAPPETTFAIAPAKIGVPYHIYGLLNFLNSVPLPTVKELLFTATTISADRALRVGPVNHVLPGPEVEATSRASSPRSAVPSSSTEASSPAPATSPPGGRISS
jgi:methylmalonyl-CoA decarboxylase